MEAAVTQILNCVDALFLDGNTMIIMSLPIAYFGLKKARNLLRIGGR